MTKRKKETVEAELAELRKQEQEVGERITRIEGELDELLALEEEAQAKYVSGKVQEFQKQRDGASSPLDAAGGQR